MTDNTIEQIIYQDTLEHGISVLCAAVGVDTERYDTDQADIACYIDCFNEMAGLLKRSGYKLDDESGGFICQPQMNKQENIIEQYSEPVTFDDGSGGDAINIFHLPDIIALCQPQWISVDERLPEEYGNDVIWYKPPGYVGVGHYCGSEGPHYETKHCFINKLEAPDFRGDYDYPVGITRWMPLPQPLYELT